MRLNYTSVNRSPIIGKLSVIIFFIFLVGCKDEDENDRVPRIATNITLNLDLPEYQTLLNPGGWIYLTGGSRGIIVYRVNLDEFAAFDRHCTYNVPEACRVSVDEDTGLTAVDTQCCGSEFEIITGSVVEGPAQLGLSPFQTQFNPNNNTLRVFN